jgi:hypothetical protein
LLFGAVMKRTALALTLILSLFSTIAVTQKISLTEANPNMIKQPYCDISIHSPQNIIYDTDNILLNFTVKTNYSIPPERVYFYSLEGQDMQSSGKIEDLQIGEENITGDTIFPYIEYTIRGQAELPLLTDGPHSLKVFDGYFYGDGIIDWSGSRSAATAWFIVDTPSAEPSASSITSTMSNLTIVSPQNKTYNSKILNLKATAYWFLADVNEMSYSIDGIGSYSLSLGKPETESFNPLNGTVIGEAALPELTEGPHEITVDVKGTGYFPETRDNMEQATVYFTIDATQPIISGLSVENKTYNQLDLALDFTLNEPTAWIGYSLDYEANVTLTGNTTLTLKEGIHSITIYANDTAGNMGNSETIYFAIEQVFPTIPVAAGIATTAIVSLSFLIYFKKRK